jgi:hypothetical protein
MLRRKFLATRISCITAWLFAGFSFAAISAMGAPKLEVDALGQTAPYRLVRISTGAVVDNATNGAEVPMQRVSQVGDIGTFTLTTRAKNDGTDTINWGFPVRELAGNAWVAANGGNFSGRSEGINHEHNKILPGAPAAGHDFYGPHPHLQMFLFCQAPDKSGLDDLVLLGTSGLKHTFSTATQFNQPHRTDPDLRFELNLGSDANPHFFGPGEIDTYTNNSNKDRDFLGPISEIDKTTFVVANHDHFGTRAMVPDPMNPAVMIPLTENGFNVWDRDHGEKEDAGDPLIHRLEANVKNLDITLQPTGTKWFAAASYFVPGEAEADRANNTIYRQFDPTDLTKIKWVGASIRGPFLMPRDEFVAGELLHVPEPSTLLLSTIGIGFLLYRPCWRVRLHVSTSVER